MLSVLILAAGESARMGSPKALLDIAGETFLQCLIRKAGEAGITSIVVVTGPHHDAIRRHLTGNVRVIQNPEPSKEQISSMQIGMRVLGSPEDILVWPVDQPLVQTDTLRKLIECHRISNSSLTIPVYQKKRGHPVIYGKQAAQAALLLLPHQTGKDLLNIFSASVCSVDVEDSGVITDIDTPEDYERYINSLNPPKV